MNGTMNGTRTTIDWPTLCERHGVELRREYPRDGNGKYIFVCPNCKEETMAAFRSIFPAESRLTQELKKCEYRPAPSDANKED